MGSLFSTINSYILQLCQKHCHSHWYIPRSTSYSDTTKHYYNAATLLKNSKLFFWKCAVKNSEIYRKDLLIELILSRLKAYKLQPSVIAVFKIQEIHKDQLRISCSKQLFRKPQEGLQVYFNPIQDGLFRGCSRLICHIYHTTMKLGTVIPYLKQIQ